MNSAIKDFADRRFLPIKLPVLRRLTWKSASVLAAAAAGTVYFLSKRSPLGVIAGGITAYITARVVTDLAQRKPDALAGDASTVVELAAMEQVVREVRIEQTPPFVYAIARNANNVPLLLPLVKLVNEVTADRAIWTVKTWAVSALLDVQVLDDLENEFMAMSFSYHGRHLGECLIKFATTDDGFSQVTMLARYHPLLGGLGDGIVRPFVIKEADTFLMRLKQLAESSEIAPEA